VWIFFLISQRLGWERARLPGRRSGVTMRPVFCGNFDLDTRQYDLERLFSKYGPVSRIDMKSGIDYSTILHYFRFFTVVLKFNAGGKFPPSPSLQVSCV
jgi:hypothetical protein